MSFALEIISVVQPDYETFLLYPHQLLYGEFFLTKAGILDCLKVLPFKHEFYKQWLVKDNVIYTLGPDQLLLREWAILISMPYVIATI